MDEKYQLPMWAKSEGVCWRHLPGMREEGQMTQKTKEEVARDPSLDCLSRAALYEAGYAHGFDKASEIIKEKDVELERLRERMTFFGGMSLATRKMVSHNSRKYASSCKPPEMSMKDWRASKEYSRVARHFTAGVKCEYAYAAKELTTLRAQLEALELNYGLREQEIKEICDNSDESKWVYWRKMYTSTRAQLEATEKDAVQAQREIAVLSDKLETAVGGLNRAKTLFTLIRVPPITEPVGTHDLRSFWERDKRDAANGLMEIHETLAKIEAMKGEG